MREKERRKEGRKEDRRYFSVESSFSDGLCEHMYVVTQGKRARTSIYIGPASRSRPRLRTRHFTVITSESLMRSANDTYLRAPTVHYGGYLSTAMCTRTHESTYGREYVRH